MTSRYELLINSIHQTDVFIVQMFLFALFALLGYAALIWMPPFLRRPIQTIYLILALTAFIFVTVFSSAS